MRPRKQIVLYSTSPMLLSRWSLIFDLHGYRVHEAEGLRDAFRLSTGADVRCAVLLHESPLDRALELASDLWAICEDHLALRIVIVNYTEKKMVATCDRIVQGTFVNREVLEAVKDVTMLWRGPKIAPQASRPRFPSQATG